jgi:hypothetical protein
MGDTEFLAPFRKMSAEAEKLFATGELFMRAAFQVRDPADAKDLKSFAERMFKEARRAYDSIPTPSQPQDTSHD